MNLNTFKTWALNAGSVGKYTDGQFVGECVSLINQYLGRVFGISAGAWGNAKDWANNPSVAQYFDKVSSPQPGDIGVQGSNYGGGYGHIFIYLPGNQILEQNGALSRRVGTRPAPGGVIAILRRKGASAGGGMTIEQVVQIAETRRVQLEEASQKIAGLISLAEARMREIESLRDNLNKVVAIAEQRLTEAGQKDAQITADQKTIQELQKQVAEAPKPTEDTEILNAFGSALVKLLARFGIKK